MSRGNPDYFGQSIYSKFGTIKGYRGGGITIPAGTSDDFFSITGKGKTYGGFIIATISAGGNSGISLILDGVEWSYIPFLYLQYFANYHIQTTWLTCFTMVGSAQFGFLFTIGRDITFEKSLGLRWINGEVIVHNIDYYELEYMFVE